LLRLLLAANYVVEIVDSYQMLLNTEKKPKNLWNDEHSDGPGWFITDDHDMFTGVITIEYLPRDGVERTYADYDQPLGGIHVVLGFLINPGYGNAPRLEPWAGIAKPGSKISRLENPGLNGLTSSEIYGLKTSLLDDSERDLFSLLSYIRISERRLTNSY
jgi:hypothetical protein